MQCDGDWEHGLGVTIETSDNLVRQVSIDLSGTTAQALPLEPTETHRCDLHDDPERPVPQPRLRR
jgi:hypothetical protein